jgi:hypothetical protein
MSGTTSFQVLPSPGIRITETDFSQAVIQVATTPAGIAGLFSWGKVNEPVVVTANSLPRTFGTPTNNNAETYFTVANYLTYTNAAYVIRTVANDVFNAVASSANVSNNTLAILNTDSYNELVATTGYAANSALLWSAKYPGALGNSLLVSVCDSVNAYSQDIFTAIAAAGANTANVSFTFNIGSNTASATFPLAAGANTFTSTVSLNDVIRVGNSTIGYQNLNISGYQTSGNGTILTINFAQNYSLVQDFVITAGESANNTFTRYWKYFNAVTGAPGTTSYVNSRGGSGDALHVVVVDNLGLFTGTPGTVLKTYQNLSRATDALNSTGQNNYYASVINHNDSFVWWLNDPQANYSLTSANMIPLNTKPQYLYLQAGTDGASTEGTVAPSVIMNGYNLFAENEFYQPSIYMAGKSIGGVANTLTAQYLINNIAGKLKNAIAVVSPDRSFVVNNKGSEATDIIEQTIPQLSGSSYGVLDSGYKYQYDPFNNVFRYVPLNGDVAGLMSRTDYNSNVWVSPAGYSRGVINNVIKLAYNPRQEDRDLLYPAGCNPIISTKSNGVILFGDETLLGDPGSVFIDIGVRRLFIALEVAIAAAAKYELFNFNDPTTQALFKNMVNPFLTQVQGQRGIINFDVICDSTNNTDQVISSKGFVADIYIQPNRSINTIQLNFNAVGTTAVFQELTAGNYFG